MAKKKAKKKVVRSSNTPPLDPDWEEQIPEPVQDAVDRYTKSIRAKNKAGEKVRNDRELCIDAMREHDIKMAYIDEGAKVLRLEDSCKLVIEKAKTKDDANN